MRRCSAPASSVRVLFLCPQLGQGGLERQVSLVAPALREGGDEVAVAVWNHRPDSRYVAPLVDAGVTVLPVPGRRGPGKLVGLARLARRWSPEVVHAYSFYANVAAAVAATASGAAAIGSVRNDYEVERARAGTALGRLSSRYPRTIVANSTAAADQARRQQGWWAPRTVVDLPNGIDVRAYDPSPTAPTGPPLVLGVGTLDHRKRWDRAIEVAAALRDRGVPFRLVIVGEGPDRSALEAAVAAHDLGDRVTLPGAVDDPRPLYAEARAVLLMSEHEGMPNVVLEAMAAGRPVVARDVGDVARLLAAGGGTVIPRDDPEKATDALEHLLRDEAAAHEVGRAGRAHVEATYSVERLATDLRTLYLDVASG